MHFVWTMGFSTELEHLPQQWQKDGTFALPTQLRDKWDPSA